MIRSKESNIFIFLRWACEASLSLYQTMTNLQDITTDQQFTDLCSKKDTVLALNFWASWAEPCQQMNDVFAELAGKFSAIQFLKVKVADPHSFDKIAHSIGCM
jgi:thiol-disulfide isomerase/thioredoxin